MNLSMQLSIAKNIIRYGSLSHLSPIFMIADVCIGLEKLPSRKTRYLQCIKVTMFKWTGKETYGLKSGMFKHALRPDMPCD